MKLAPIATATLLSLLLIGCNSEPEETPDITEAIPVPGEDSDAAGDAVEAAEAGSGGVGNGAPASAASTSPSTMESGSNEDGGRVPEPGRTKLIPAD